jgi:chromate transporter
LVGYMHRDWVEECKWTGEEVYKNGLVLAQLAPGPLAANRVSFGVMSITESKVLRCAYQPLFFLFLMVVLIGMAYQLFGGLPWLQVNFYGVGAATVGIIVVSCYKLAENPLVDLAASPFRMIGFFGFSI